MVTENENDQYRKFVADKLNDLGCWEIGSTDVIWHYTDGAGLLGIIESGQIHATQVSCLNDLTETTYAMGLFRSATTRLRDSLPDHPSKEFLSGVLKYLADDSPTPDHVQSKFFVACFTSHGDHLGQWQTYGGRGQDNGYAIGFHPRGLLLGGENILVKVSYNKAQHEAMADEVAAKTLEFYQLGLAGQRAADPKAWAEEFFPAWDQWIYRMAPAAKDEAFSQEGEFRIIHSLSTSDFHHVRFRQRATFLSRFIPLSSPAWTRCRTPMLPIKSVMIGPGDHTRVTKQSLEMLLEQMGYRNCPVVVSQRPIRRV